jgi:hypothetical protein
VFELEPDLLAAKDAESTMTRGKKPRAWCPTFWPEQYVKDGHDITLAGNRLTEEQLLRLGQKATIARRIQRERAAAIKNEGEVIDADAYLRSAKNLAEKMHLGYFKIPKSENICH